MDSIIEDNHLHIIIEGEVAVKKELDKLRYEILLEEVVDQRWEEIVEFAKKENL